MKPSTNALAEEIFKRKEMFSSFINPKYFGSRLPVLVSAFAIAGGLLVANLKISSFTDTWDKLFKTYPPSSWTGKVLDGVCSESQLGSGNTYVVTLRDEKTGIPKTISYGAQQAVDMCDQRSKMPNINDRWKVDITNPTLDPEKTDFFANEVNVAVLPSGQVPSSAAQRDFTPR